ncbi:hypothetical protein Scep_021913 [Stephania cephalantha]|uniref:Uncharacterized protein n=1 Tax=Stephania cephalantha TaxID=152367 RepID=A0AAP0FF94_9MAGN
MAVYNGVLKRYRVFGASVDNPLSPKTLVDKSRTVRHGRSFRFSEVVNEEGRKMEANVAMENKEPFNVCPSNYNVYQNDPKP